MKIKKKGVKKTRGGSSSSAGESGSAAATAAAATRLISQLSARANRIVSARHDPGNTWIKLFTRLQTNCGVLRVALSFHYGRQEVAAAAAACQSEQGCARLSVSLRARRSPSPLFSPVTPALPQWLRLPAAPLFLLHSPVLPLLFSCQLSSRRGPPLPPIALAPPTHHHRHLPLPSVSHFLPPD